VELTRALAEATGAAQAQLELEIARLQEQLAARTRTLFSPSSERRVLRLEQQGHLPQPLEVRLRRELHHRPARVSLC